MAAGIICIAKEDSKTNLANLFTKHLDYLNVSSYKSTSFIDCPLCSSYPVILSQSIGTD